ncbi:serine/threonine protein kinase [Sorangium cellulosum]|uniref:Serine/threonine protein kinase n=1 Tax=Sorangium cellulosum TaxID=56 RepID=A0A2L0FBU8_SORCE|nr:AAA family ATPase [Sorangium cellulosum]AUX49003.1 serine/threonine protein kinase [Sorangium cellulosum]
MTTTAAVDLPGHVIEQLVHEGSRTCVYRGRRTADQRPVVIKALKGEHPNVRDLALLRHEFGLLRELDLDAAVRAYALERTRGGLALVMEAVEGTTLRALLDARRLDLRTALSLAASIADAIGAVHRRHVTHKDINPSNIVISPDLLRATLIDFGVASRLKQEFQQSTTVSALQGTLAYMAPEQTGRMNRGIDHRADLYSFGVTLYEMLTGALPFSGADPIDVLYSHIARQPVPPHERRGDVPRPVSDIVMKLLAKTPEDRYQSAYGVKADLAECLRSLEQTGRVHPFPIGRSDRSDELRIPQKLYGRDVERRRLLSALERARAGAAELVLVSGYSGVGKSALVHETYKAIAGAGGYFAHGKFDQLSRGVPCASLVQAFRGLVQQILSERTEALSRWRAELAAALGANAGVLHELIPELALITGEAPAVAALGPSESQNRFDMVFRSFLGVLAAPAHPLVLFLDDLQWADPASLRLLRVVLTDPDTGHLLVVGAYRDNEVSPAHPLTITLDALRAANAAVTDTPLVPLSQEDVTELVSDTLGCAARDVAQLSGLIHEKTQGNPFFIGQFLRMLSDDGLLRCAPETGRWTWDLAAIESRAVTDNVVEFMIAKLQRLSQRTQRAMKLAACIGHRFDLRTLATISEQPAREAAQDLWEAMQEGVLLPMDPDYRLVQSEGQAQGEPPSEASLAVPYQFLHDRVQQAAYGLIADEHKRAAHLRVGRLMLASESGEPAEEQLFDVVNHLNYGARLIDDPGEREALARLNLRAGRKAKGSTAYGAAAEYFSAGRSALADGGAARDPALSWALTLEAAECEYLCGRFAEAEALFQRLLEVARSNLDSARVQSLRMKLYQVAGRYDEGVTVGQEGLRLFGVEIPGTSEEIGAAVSAEIAQIPGSMAGRSIEDILHAPLLADEHIRAIINLLADCAPCAYIGRPSVFPLIALKMLNLSLRHGNTEASCFAYSVYGPMLAAAFGDIPSGFRFSEMSIRLNEKLGDISLRGTLLHLHGDHVNFWVQHIRSDLPILERAFLACLEAGDLVYASYLAFETVWQVYEKGDPLAEVHRVAERYASFARKTGNHAVLETIRLEQQFLRSLQGLTAADASLSEEGFAEEECLAALTRASFGCGIAFYHIIRLILSYSHGRPEAALAAADAARPVLGAVMSMPIETTYHFYLALTLVALGERDERERQRHAEALSASLGKLELWAGHCPDNFRAKHLLVLAEIARTSGRDAEAMGLYDEAVEAARQSEFLQYEALASELAGLYYARKGRRRIAALYLGSAAHAYRQWGAERKAAELVRQHGLDALPASPVDRAPAAEQGRAITSSSSISVNHPLLNKLVDVAAVLQATHAISSELVLGRALDRVMRAVLASAGGQRGFLVLAREDRLVVEAAITIDPESIEVELRRPLELSTDLPVSVVHYVARTRELVILDDAAASARFAADPYLAARRPRSAMGLALVHQNRLTGVLYVENALASGAFAPEQAELLRLLGAQIAAALENALLYGRLQEVSEGHRALSDRLESEVKRRTEEVCSVNERLSQKAEELNRMNERLLEELRERERAEQARAALQEEIIEVQRLRLSEMATPIIPITDRVLVMPLIGTMDAARAAQVLEATLAGVQRHNPSVVIIDITGLKHVDAGVADTLIRTASALRLLGAQAILTGMQPEVARALVQGGIDLRGIVTRSTLQSAVAHALAPRAAGAH